MISLNGYPIDCSKHFPDGTLNLKINEDAIKSVVETAEIFTPVVRWNYQGEEEMAALFYVVGWLRGHRFETIDLELPYVPNARMDRIRSNDEVFTLKYFGKFINSLNFHCVRVFDPHSDVVAGVIDNIMVDKPSFYIAKACAQIGAEDILPYYPDKGAVRRYADAGEVYAFGDKERIWETGKIIGLQVIVPEGMDITGKSVLMIDDICTNGDTFYYSAMTLRRMGVKGVFAYCSHCENSVLKSELLTTEGLIDRLFTTDSVYTGSHPKIEVFKWRKW